MSHQVILPPLDGSDTFVVEHYYVVVNDEVVAGQPFALVRSEHWAWELPATANGIVRALVAEPGSTVAARAVLIELRDQRPTNDDQQSPNNDEQQQAIEAQNRDAVPIMIAQRVRATPVARRMIAAHGLDPAALIGTGRGKVVTRADVLAVIGNREQAPSTLWLRDPGNKEQGNTETREQRATKEQRAVMEETQPSVDRPSSIVHRLNLPTFNVQHSMFHTRSHRSKWI
jgi:pyruvate/2-oxoglutarate dehydrogenase complex dihydrolipoamide acyltransferase (E2) component